MHISLLFVLGVFVTLSLSTPFSPRTTSNITCGTPISNGTLWYGNSTNRYTGQTAILEAYGNAELLVKYPGDYMTSALQLLAIPCNSSYLNTAAAVTATKEFVILQYANDPSSCLGIQDASSSDVFIVKQACSMVDGNEQANLFWTQVMRGEKKHRLLYPAGGMRQPARHWSVIVNEYASDEIIAEPPSCPKGEICEDEPHLSLIIKEVA